MTQSYYRQADCVAVIYDVTDQETFDHVKDWWKEIDRYVTKKNVARLLIGNKTDKDSAVVSTETGSQLAKSLGATHFYETRY